MQAPKTLRDYQADAVGSILRCWKDNRSCLAVMATGGGKTLVAASAADQLLDQVDGRVLYLANRNELCLQPLETFTQQLGFVPGLEKAESRASLSAPVVIGSVQTLCRTSRLERFSPHHFTHIFADEAHMSLGKTWGRIFSHFKDAKLCGITATPFRSDAKDLRDVYEAEAYRKSLFELVDAGWLVNPDNVYRLDAAISLAQVRVKRTTEGVDYDVKEAADAILPYFKAICDEIAEKHASRHILAFLPLIESSKKFVAAAREAGINAVHIDGEDPERAAKLRAFGEGKIQLLSNSNLLHTGVDIPRVDATLCLRPTRSKVLYQQVVGRSTRPLPGVVDGLQSALERQEAIGASAKPNALIIDPLWLTTDMDLVTPAYLIAENQEQAGEIQKLASRGGKNYNLAELKAQVVRNREEAIKRRLDNVASFRGFGLDYKYFAAQTQEHGLLVYEPIYRKECVRPSNFVLSRIRQAGIDPSNVTTAGLADQILQAIGRRRYQQRAEIRQLAAIAEAEGISPALWTISKWDKRLEAK